MLLVLAGPRALSDFRRQKLLAEIEPIIFPVLFHSVSIDGLDSIEEGLDCITMILYYGYKNRPVSAEMWTIFP